MQYSWQDIRDQAIEDFKEAPGGELEGEILEQFQQRPKTVVTMIDKITNDIKKGKPIRSGWAVLRSSLRNSRSDVIVDDKSERDRAVVAANAWLSNAGLYVEDEDSIIDELFTFGLLSAWKGDTALREQILSRWRDLRPLGAQAEADSLHYQASIRHADRVMSRVRGRPASAEDSDPPSVADRDDS